MNETTTFEQLNISAGLIEKLNAHQITRPTAVQAQAIPEIMKGTSLLFQSETGTGKTFAYLLPLIQKIEEQPNERKEIKLIINAPTVELASQIKVQVQVLTSLKSVLLVGGAPVKRQIELLKEKPAIVIGTSARLLELFHLKKLKVEGVETIVLDEVDRLLSPEIRDETIELVTALKKDVQLIANSATISANTERILSETKILSDGSKICEVKTLFLPPEDVLKKRITHIAVFAERRDKIETLRKLLIALKGEKVLIFTGKIDQVANIVVKLKYKNIECTGLHAKTDKVERKSTIDRFRSGKLKVLVTSDLTSRGLDIPDITHVIQMDMPSNDDFFIHRAGRTARAGKTGFNVVIGDEYEMRKFAAIEKKLGIIVYPKIVYKGRLASPEELEKQD